MGGCVLAFIGIKHTEFSVWTMDYIVVTVVDG